MLNNLPDSHLSDIRDIFFFVAVRLYCAPWAYSYIISGAGIVSGIPRTQPCI